MEDQDNATKKNGTRAGDDGPHGESANNKGKGKAKDLGILDRIQESGRLAFNALAANTVIPEAVRGSKASAGSSRSTGASSMVSNESSLSTNKIGLSGSIKTAKDAVDSTEAFDNFITGSQSELLNEAAAVQFHSQSVVEQEASDGFAVVDLLSRLDDLDYMLDMPAGDGLLTPEEADRLREALFGSGDNYPCWEKLLDFSPDFLSQPETLHEAVIHLGTSDVITARSLWFQQWNGVFTAYNSQVWGDLEPLVAKAKLEINLLGTQSLDIGKTVDVGALGRLRQILAHVRGHR